MTKERPISFSAPMVRSILEGRKIQTRRIIKKQNLVGAPSYGFNAYEVEDSNGNRFWGFSSDDDDWKCPYGGPGDRLWVREPAKLSAVDDGSYIVSGVGEAMVEIEYLADEKRSWVAYPSRLAALFVGHGLPNGSYREASRITLEITSVRVERLQDISTDDCRREGIDSEEQFSWIGKTLPGKEYKTCPLSPLQRSFGALWQSIYTKEGQTWDDNPWVWVVEFKRVEA